MAPFPKSLKDLCTPAVIYFVISIVSLAMVLLQNFIRWDHSLALFRAQR